MTSDAAANAAAPEAAAPDHAAPAHTAAAHREAVRYLNDPRSIRARSEQLFERLARGDSAHLVYHPEELARAAAWVAQVTRESYPTLDIPYHARANHFLAGPASSRAAGSRGDSAKPDTSQSGPDISGMARFARLFEALSSDEGRPEEIRAERARGEFDLTLTSVLLDAGAGPDWSYVEPHTSDSYARSEGLAVASLHWFASGAFSSHPKTPLRADASALRALTREALEAGFQVSRANPLVGVEGRLGLLHELGAALEAHPELFPGGRAGSLFDVLSARATQGVLRAEQILEALLSGLSSIWPGREELGGVNLGDVWRHSALAGCSPAPGLIPFHKLSQWLSYSLVVPLERAGVRVIELDTLTGLPEYRNGGLFLDTGVLSLRDPTQSERPQQPGGELIIEWRAATIALIDRLAPLVRAELGVSAEDLPLPRVLEGGTWAAGRRLAAKLRGGLPPLSLASDGTVF